MFYTYTPYQKKTPIIPIIPIEKERKTNIIKYMDMFSIQNTKPTRCSSCQK